jgi:glycosyltransferase involved in cell wall biosynthesis
MEENFVHENPQPSIFILTGAFDDTYLETRQDDPVVCTSAGKRMILYRAIQEATDSKITLLSPHPKGRGTPYPLPETESYFSGIRQVFAKASPRRKIRFLLNIIHYAHLVYRQTHDGAIMIMDNYEIIYVVAHGYCRFRGRKNPLVLEYEDGKHAIDKGFWRLLSGLAEFLVKHQVKAAIVATPSLLKRLPHNLPSEVVPGMLNPDRPLPQIPKGNEPIRIIYSGSLDYERGVPLLLDYLESNEVHPNAEFHITGQGHFTNRIYEICEKSKGQVTFHGILPREDLSRLQRSCHFGLNLQSAKNPISEVTYPSKTFDYVNMGLRVISTRAAGVDVVFGEWGIYLASESIESLAKAISSAVTNARSTDLDLGQYDMKKYTYHGIVGRLEHLMRCF